MKIKTLYRYERDHGKLTVSTKKPECDYTEKFRVIADEGMLVTQDGMNLTPVVDVDSVDGWYEVEDPEAKELENN